MDAFLVLAWPIVMGLAAAGAVLAIKIARRRQATRRGDFDGTVPANPMSAEDARRLRRGYFWTAAAVAAGLVVMAFSLANTP